MASPTMPLSSDGLVVPYNGAKPKYFFNGLVESKVGSQGCSCGQDRRRRLVVINDARFLIVQVPKGPSVSSVRGSTT